MLLLESQRMTTYMRFIAVFDQYQTSTGVGFDSLVEAVDFLFWGYEDQNLVPQGIYDILADQATPYTHAGQPITEVDSNCIRLIASDYLKRITHQTTCLRASLG